MYVKNLLQCLQGTGDPLVDILMWPVFFLFIGLIMTAFHQQQYFFAFLCCAGFCVQIWNTFRLMPEECIPPFEEEFEKPVKPKNQSIGSGVRHFHVPLSEKT